MSHTHQHVEAQPISREVENNTADKADTVETKDIVTPYAFGVAESLLGKRLATPFQRGLAQCIDLLFVAILSSLDALFLAIIATATFYKASHNLAHNSDRKTTRSFLRIGGAFMLFWTVLLTLDVANEANYFRDDTIANNSSDTGNSSGKKNVAIESVGVSGPFRNKNSSVEASQKIADIDKEIADFDEPPSETLTATYSIVKWIKGLITDLGLGFGWAALYYSVFTAWFSGKTSGKRLLNIQVLKLDGSGLSLWESFGRYGGYGAGLATGLLGFMQIYWDPNRQAIQDKISETLVISYRN
ncbi:RDD family protein [Alteromonas gracilis]|uniref:RDD family protein n=1 Tax=Alteromonas gracilis TaxID=1479524 RepID=UPI003734DF26